MRLDLTLGGVCVSSYCGNLSIGFAHLKSHNVNQDVQRRGLYGGLVAEHCVHYHSYPHNLGRCSYPVREPRLQRLDIQDCHIPLSGQVSDHLSSSGVTHLWRELNSFAHLQRKPLWIYQLVSYLLAYLLKMLKSWLASLVDKVFPMWSASLYGWQRFLLLPLAAWQGYQSYFLKLNQVSYPYLNSTINGSRL